MTNSELIEIINLFEYKVEDHGDGKYSVTDPGDDGKGGDPSDDSNYWKAVASETALLDTYNMIVNDPSLMYSRGYGDGYDDVLSDDRFEENEHYMNGYCDGSRDC